MSTENSIAKGGRDQAVQGEPNGLDLPPGVQARYDVRLVDQPGSSEPRIGLFALNDRLNPAIEISGDRIVANREDAETIDSLVKIARHNGWDSIDVDGSPEFRKAMWAAATREGLTVKGYEPSFVEQEKAASDRRERETKAEAPAAPVGKPGRDADARVSPAPPDQGIATPTAATVDQGAAVERGAAALAAMGPLLEERRTLRTRFDRSSELPDDKFSNLIDARTKNEDALRETWATVLKSPDYARRIEADGNSVDALEASGRGGRWQEDVEGVVTRLREAEPAPQLSDEDSRLLLKVSALTEDRKALYAKLTGRMDWGRAVTVLIGIGIIFSAATIVGWMGGSA